MKLLDQFCVLLKNVTLLRYLYEFLYGWLISAYNRAESFLLEHQSILELVKSKAKGAGSAKKGGQSNAKSKKKKEKNNSRPYAKEIAYCQAIQSMCGGYYKVRLLYFLFVFLKIVKEITEVRVIFVII